MKQTTSQNNKDMKHSTSQERNASRGSQNRFEKESVKNSPKSASNKTSSRNTRK